MTSKKKYTHIILSLMLILSLTSCLSYDFSRRIVQQGNLLPPEKIQQLHIGMSKDKVVAIMGMSLLTSTFTNDRWDYAYTYRKGNGAMEKRHLTLFFTNGTLRSIKS